VRQPDVGQDVRLPQAIERLGRGAEERADHQDRDQDGTAAYRLQAPGGRGADGAEGVVRRALGTLEVPLRHDREQAERQQHVQRPTDHDGQADVDGGERHAEAGAEQRAELGGLRAAQEDAPDPLLAHFVGDPGLPRATDEGRADAPDHLSQQHRREQGEAALQHEAEPDQRQPDDDREASAVDVGHDAGRQLHQEAGALEHRADQQQLEGVQVGDGHQIDAGDGRDGGEEER
jgi:hypothetical protein